MADVYQFSESSLELLARCIGTANEPERKWMELFKPETKEENAVQQQNVSLSDQGTHKVLASTSQASQSAEEMEIDEQHKQNEQQTENDQVHRIVAVLEADPSNKIEYLAEYSNNKLLLSALVEKLSAECLERICEDLLEHSNSHEEILKHFVAAYIKKETSCNTLNMLVKAYKTHQSTLLSLMESLFINIDMSTKVLEEFFNAIDKSACSQFLHTISRKELTTDVFILRINIINHLYKCIEKTSDIQNFLLNELLKSCQLCRQDKNYGRCLLTFFQGLQEHDQVNRQTLEKVISAHQTPFKRLCQSILDNLYKVND